MNMGFFKIVFIKVFIPYICGTTILGYLRSPMFHCKFGAKILLVPISTSELTKYFPVKRLSFSPTLPME